MERERAVLQIILTRNLRNSTRNLHTLKYCAQVTKFIAGRSAERKALSPGAPLTLSPDAPGWEPGAEATPTR